MKIFDILKQEETFCNQIWRTNYEENIKGKCGSLVHSILPSNLYHMHVCDFELCNFKDCRNSKQLHKLSKKKCIEYLKSLGKTRDKDLCCCDTCIHDRYITISNEIDDLILNIATLGVEDRIIKEG